MLLLEPTQFLPLALAPVLPLLLVQELLPLAFRPVLLA